MKAYVEYLQRVWAELIKLPEEEFHKKMQEISSPSIQDFISRPIKLLDEPIEYCQPTPRGYIRAIKILENK